MFRRRAGVCSFALYAHPAHDSYCPPLPRRLNVRDESGLTLIELMVVFIVLAVLAAVAVPSYLGTRDRANVAAAKSAVRSSIPAIEAYRTENDTYVGVTPAALTAAYGASYSAILIPNRDDDVVLR